MWENYVSALAEYCKCICVEWISRGFEDSVLDKIQKCLVTNPLMPYWFGDDKFHASHRSNLLRKDFDYYSKFGWIETSTLPYYWPKFKDYRMPGFLKTNRTFIQQEKWTMAVRINVCKPGVAPINAEVKMPCDFLKIEDVVQFVHDNIEVTKAVIFAYSPDGEEYVWRS